MSRIELKLGDALYHGTHSTRAQAAIRTDGSYEYPNRDPIWLASESGTAERRARWVAERCNASPVVLTINPDRLLERRIPLLRPPRLGSEMEDPDYWIVYGLPSGSFLYEFV